MTHAKHQIEIAIADSIRENRIVHIAETIDTQEWVDLAAELSSQYEDYVEYGTEIGRSREYWGTDDDGDEWRVHLDGTR